MAEVNQIIQIIKLVCIICILVLIAVKDLKEYRIPNKLLIFATLSRGVIFIIELLLVDVSVKDIIRKSIIILGIFVIGIIFNIITRNGFGIGDVKLLMVVAMFIDVNQISNLIVNAIMIMGVITLILLVLRKKKNKDVVPFAPAVLIAVITTGINFL